MNILQKIITIKKTFLITIIILFSMVSSACNYNKVKDKNEVNETTKYFSDYFVFIALDEPLVVPFDFNWSLSKKGYNREFKSWYGTKEKWPIAYFTDRVKTKNIPQETWEHSDNRNFKFNKSEKSISIHIDGAPKMTVFIPEKSEWKAMPKQQNNKEIFAFKTSLKKEGRTINGWMIYERIRWDANFVKTFGDFKAFYWVPLIINNNFFHFEWHHGYGHKTATKWSIEDHKIQVDTIADFTFDIIETEKDKKSGRGDIPKSIQVKVPDWNIDISLQSGGSQVGHGAQFPKGLAYYRQSILLAKNNSKTKGYGMLELILENN